MNPVLRIAKKETAIETTEGFNWRKTPGLSILVGAVFVFLYAPLLVLATFSFNSGSLVTVWDGFGLRWFRSIWNNPDIGAAAINSIEVALLSSAAGIVFAVPAALSIERGRRFTGRPLVIAALGLPLVIPEVIAAVTTLMFFTLIHLRLGIVNLVLAHAVFTIPCVLLPVRARLQELGTTLEEAGRDLYASELRIFCHVTVPMIWPAVLSGALLAFVTSFDNFLVSQMVAEPGTTTLPMYIYGMIRLGVKPEINAITTIMLTCSLAILCSAMAIRRSKPTH